VQKTYTYTENVKNPNLGVVPICRNVKMEWMPSMATQRSLKMLKGEERT